MKCKMRGVQYRNIDTVKQTVLDCISDIPAAQWVDCFDQWIARCEKCILHEGRYFEGMKYPPT